MVAWRRASGHRLVLEGHVRFESGLVVHVKVCSSRFPTRRTFAFRLGDRLKAAAAEELDILQRALDNLPGWSLPC